VSLNSELVAKHHYAIEAFAAKLKPATQPAKSVTEEQTPACAPPANNERRKTAAR
jgi:hypothetical protein